MLSSTPSSKISQYCTASIFPYTSIGVPTPFQLIHPQIIKLFPPPCVIGGVLVLSDTGSPYCFQTYTFPSDSILLIFVSSIHNTFQSSTVQFPWYWANFRYCWWWDPLSIGTFFFVTDLKPASFNTFLTVWGVTELDMVNLWIEWLEQHCQASQSWFDG